MFNKKFSKVLNEALEVNNILEANALQQLCISKINSGVDVVIESPEKTGKSTTLAITTIHKLKYAVEDVPRALIISPTVESCDALFAQFKLLAAGSDLRIHVAHEKGLIDKQGEDIYFGADVVIGTPRRILEIYFHKNLYINKLKLFAIDDIETLVKNQHQGEIHRLSDSLPKCQRLALTDKLTERIETLLDKFMVTPHLVQCD